METIQNKESKLKYIEYLPTLQKHKDEGGHFPYRYTCDENQKILPFVLVSAFFRNDKERVEMYNEYMQHDIKLVGITAYKSFPKPITDATGDSGTKDDTFDYYTNIKNWLCCFKEPEDYGFDYDKHRIIDISESDFYDVDTNPEVEKKYDIIYVCLKDNDSCPADGWNAINRNFDLAQKCLPIIINEFKLKVLVVGRINCGLEKLYGDNIEVVDFLPYHEFQNKMRQSKILFIPNIYDASPRVVAEAITKNIVVLMNRNIVCGSKYINYETGHLFTDEHDIRLSLSTLLEKQSKISPKKWWEKNYSRKKSAIKFRDFLYISYPEYLENTKEIYFY
jgi:hypothetical protein